MTASDMTRGWTKQQERLKPASTAWLNQAHHESLSERNAEDQALHLIRPPTGPSAHLATPQLAWVKTNGTILGWVHHPFQSLLVGIGMFTGGTIWVSTHSHLRELPFERTFRLTPKKFSAPWPAVPCPAHWAPSRPQETEGGTNHYRPVGRVDKSSIRVAKDWPLF